MVGATSIRFAAVALMLIVAACDSRQVSPTTPSASVSASGTGVPRMGGTSMAYDPGSRLVVLFGTTEEDRKTTTWTWDGRVWTQQHPRSSPTNLRGELAYDWVSSSLILFGTTYPAEEIQTWAWKEGNWTQLHPAAQPSGAGHYSYDLASDARTKRVLAFGGCCAQDVLPSQTWSWDGTTWSRLQPKTMPTDRFGVNFAYDDAIQRTVLFGGFVRSSGSQSNDLWTWDGGTWVRQYPSTTPPPDLANAAIGYDGLHKNIVLLFRSGKYDVETWTWDGQNWTPQNPSAFPLATIQYQMAWDEATAQLVLFDIVTSPQPPQTWIWTGSNWERKA
jgi:hypothetical protein